MLSFSSFPLSAGAVRILLAFLLMVFCLPPAAQAQTWQSARVVAAATAAATTNYSAVTATAVDAAGNVYLAGNFTNTVGFGSTTLASLGAQDIFVAKYNPASNQFVWVQRAGGARNDFVNSLAISGSNVYVAGSFESFTAGFGDVTLANAGSNDVFVAKLADTGSMGSFVWAQQAGGTAIDEAAALAVNGTSIYLAGHFYSPTVNFGTTILTNAGTGYDDVFVAKLTDTGSVSNFVWAQRAGGAGYDEPFALAANGTSVYVAGEFASASAAFGPSTLTNGGGFDIFVAKLNDAGNTSSFVWAQRAGGLDFDYVDDLAVSGSNVYLAGYFNSSTAAFGTTSLINAGSYDMFVAKLTDTGSTGNFVWAQRGGGTGFDSGSVLAVNGASLYVAGYFLSTTAGFGSSTLVNAGASDVFVTKLLDAGSTGNFVWAQRAGGTRYDEVYALAVNSTGVYAMGAFSSATVAFGATTLVNPNLNAPLGFLANLTDPTLTATVPGRALAPATLFPNPARHTATLRLPAGTAPAPLILTDAQGRAVRHFPAPAGAEATLDLRGLPAGLYLLRGAGPAQRLVVE